MSIRTSSGGTSGRLPKLHACTQEQQLTTNKKSIIQILCSSFFIRSPTRAQNASRSVAHCGTHRHVASHARWTALGSLASQSTSMDRKKVSGPFVPSGLCRIGGRRVPTERSSADEQLDEEIQEKKQQKAARSRRGRQGCEGRLGRVAGCVEAACGAGGGCHGIEAA